LSHRGKTAAKIKQASFILFLSAATAGEKDAAGAHDVSIE